jgi:hypothetical protein
VHRTPGAAGRLFERHAKSLRKNERKEHPMNPHRSAVHIGAAAVALSLAACATLPPPTEQLAAARAAIQSAEVAGADKVAPVELTQARERLTAAQLAVSRNETENARRLADEALVDAQLAQAKASTLRARESVAQSEAALRALREETNRPSQTAPTPVAPVAPTR